jgi:hypothetical protein
MGRAARGFRAGVAGFLEDFVVEVGLPIGGFPFGLIRSQFARHLEIRPTTRSVLKDLKCQHWCPVNGVLIFEIILFFIDKSRKGDVTDLNFLERQMLYHTDYIRSLYSLSNF